MNYFFNINKKQVSFIYYYYVKMIKFVLLIFNIDFLLAFNYLFYSNDYSMFFLIRKS